MVTGFQFLVITSYYDQQICCVTVAFDRYAIAGLIFDESFALILTVLRQLYWAWQDCWPLLLSPLSSLRLSTSTLPDRYPEFIKGKSFSFRCECLCRVVCKTSAPHPIGCEFDPPKEQIFFFSFFPLFGLKFSLRIFCKVQRLTLRLQSVEVLG